MRLPFSCEPLVHHLLDILTVPPGDLDTRLGALSLETLLALAGSERVDGYVSSWLLDTRGDAMAAGDRALVSARLDDNRVRGLFIVTQMRELAGVFERVGIPLMFLKGNAGLARGIYPFGTRPLADVDVLVPPDAIGRAVLLLGDLGYSPVEGEDDPLCPHIPPYQHPDHAAVLELHVNPYDHARTSRPVMPDIWRDAHRVDFHGAGVLVPSVTDHAWILMRTDLVNRAFLPRFRDVVELALMTNAGLRFDADVLQRRADREHIPNIVGGMALGCMLYAGMEPFAPVDDPRLRAWAAWTLDVKRRYGTSMLHRRMRLNLAMMRYVTAPGVKAKAAYLRWLLRTEQRRKLWMLILPSRLVRMSWTARRGA